MDRELCSITKSAFSLTVRMSYRGHPTNFFESRDILVDGHASTKSISRVHKLIWCFSSVSTRSSGREIN